MDFDSRASELNGELCLGDGIFDGVREVGGKSLHISPSFLRGRGSRTPTGAMDAKTPSIHPIGLGRVSIWGPHQQKPPNGPSNPTEEGGEGRRFVCSWPPPPSLKFNFPSSSPISPFASPPIPIRSNEGRRGEGMGQVPIPIIKSLPPPPIHSFIHFPSIFPQSGLSPSELTWAAAVTVEKGWGATGRHFFKWLAYPLASSSDAEEEVLSGSRGATKELRREGQIKNI